jgi:hypothetical protein
VGQWLGSSCGSSFLDSGLGFRGKTRGGGGQEPGAGDKNRPYRPFSQGKTVEDYLLLPSRVFTETRTSVRRFSELLFLQALFHFPAGRSLSTSSESLHLCQPHVCLLGQGGREPARAVCPALLGGPELVRKEPSTPAKSCNGSAPHTPDRPS